jgi:hypothetical protein
LQDGLGQVLQGASIQPPLVEPARLLRLVLLRKFKGQELFESPDGEKDEDEASRRQAQRVLARVGLRAVGKTISDDFVRVPLVSGDCTYTPLAELDRHRPRESVGPALNCLGFERLLEDALERRKDRVALELELLNLERDVVVLRFLHD